MMLQQQQRCTAVFSLFLLIAFFDQIVHGWGITNPPASVSRRGVFRSTIASATAVVLLPASAAFATDVEETDRIITRMGGLLEPYQDGPRGLRIMAPSGWNKFDGEVGAYDVKWQDLVDPTENIKISSTPVKSSVDSIAVLGDVQTVGEALAKKRGAQLLAANQRQTDNVLFYKFEFALGDGTHQLLQLCVNRGKIWSLDANAKEKRWSKRQELYNNVLGSFMPKLA